jgi:hypothetical protein
MSVGLGFAFPALSSTALTNVRPADSGVASAMVNTTQQIGGSLGTALLNTVAATATASYLRVNGPASLPAGLVHGYAVAFALGAIFLVVAAVVSLIFVTDRSAAVPAVQMDSALATN